MPIDSLQEIAISELLDSPVGDWLNNAMETVTSLQRNLFALSESEDSNQLTLMKIGTVFQIFLIDTLASGKKVEELTPEDWKNIADKVSQYAILEDEQSYSEFVFTLYADYIDLSAKALSAYGVSKENVKKVTAIAEEIRSYTERLRNEELPEVDYIEKCLWASLEAMIKCLSLSLTSVIGPEYAQLAQAATQLAFEYGRYVLYSKEQAILEEYIQKQYVLDEELKTKYEAYLEEVQAQSEQFQSLVDAAFSPDFRETLLQSVALARAAGVKEEEILRSIDDTDDFFLD